MKLNYHIFHSQANGLKSGFSTERYIRIIIITRNKQRIRLYEATAQVNYKDNESKEEEEQKIKQLYCDEKKS